MSKMRPAGITVPQGLEEKIIQIPSTSNKQVPKPDLEDNQKRWLIVGICLHNIISPALRKYVSPIIQKLYQDMRVFDYIDVQVYPNHIERYPPTGKELNYQSVNNNKTKPTPWYRGRKDFSRYDFKIVNAIDFSKLFLQTNMTHYTGFDDTCDSSALLGFINNIDKFSSSVKSVSNQIRQDVRNPWAHCNFVEWDSIKYLRSFQLMNQLVRNLNLQPADEQNLLADLQKWETNGINFLQGTTIGLELLHDLKEQIDVLAEYAKIVKSETASSLEMMSQKINDIFVRLENIEVLQEQDKVVIENLGEEVDIIYSRLTDIQSQQHDSLADVEKVKGTVDILSTDFTNLMCNSIKTENKVTDLQGQTIQTNDAVREIQNDIFELKEEVTEIKQNTIEIKKYMSDSRPPNKIFFYPPDRPQTFIGRYKELSRLEYTFSNHGDKEFTVAICGLGGCGKTTLAIEFSWQYQSFYPGGIFWMSAESNEALDDSINNLAFDVNTVGRDSAETRMRTLKWLSTLKERWLLVVDNLDGDCISGNIEELVLGSWNRNSNGHIVITSRREEVEIEESLHVSKNDCLHINAFNKEESIEFMLKRTGAGDNCDMDNLYILVDELGGHPLALEQAASHIKILQCSFGAYVARFKKKRLGILKQARPLYPNITKERLNVKTTWKMNMDYINKQSEEEGLGTTAVKVMEIASFLFADCIPIEIFNVGEPRIDCKDVYENLVDEMGSRQVTEILTRFSLFQRYYIDSVSVHRLVQEVIRDTFNDQHTCHVLKLAVRMVNKALLSTKCPQEVLKDKNVNRGSLSLWNKLALNAKSLRTHQLKFANQSTIKNQDLCFNIETVRILHTTALYNSINQHHGEALEDQSQFLHILSSLDFDKVQFDEFTCVKIPLMERDRSRIRDSMIVVLQNNLDKYETNQQEIIPLDIDTLKNIGNKAFRNKRHQDSIQYYTEGLRVCREDNDSKFRLFNNRSLAFLRTKDYENALMDANMCIELRPNFWKGYCWKAYAIANLVKSGKMKSNMEIVGIAMACVAANLNQNCLLKYTMKISYPIINYKLLNQNDNLGMQIQDLRDRVHTTLLLVKSRYVFEQSICTVKSMQIIGVEDGVEIDVGPGFHVKRLTQNDFKIIYEPESEINFHFQNVRFVSNGGQIRIHSHTKVTFFRCIFENGIKACDNYPRCKGGKGCRSPENCKIKGTELADNRDTFVGEEGSPGLAVLSGAHVHVEHCTFDRCGGCGIYCGGKGSILTITKSFVQNMRRSGIIVDGNGKLTVSESTIEKNQTDGIRIGPNGNGTVLSNIVQKNGRKGIWCGGNDFINKDQPNGESEAFIRENIVSYNGMSGIGLGGGVYEATGNRVFENWLWGIMIQSRSAVQMMNNEIFENKCGGVRIGVNYSASIVIDGNTIRDHTGPDIFSDAAEMEKTKLSSQQISMLSEINQMNEHGKYTRKHLVTNRNVCIRNNVNRQYPMGSYRHVRECCFCHVSYSLKSCGRCRKAAYCSKKCQEDHWERHRHMCQILRQSTTVEILMSKTHPGMMPCIESVTNVVISVDTPHPSLSKVDKCTPPDKHGNTRFIVKIQSGFEYTPYNPSAKLYLYDATRTVCINFSNDKLYHLVIECGILGANKLSSKKIYCWASFKNSGNILCIETGSFPSLQKW